MPDRRPESIKKISFDFWWDPEKVWKLEVPTVAMPISDFTWLFTYPWWHEGGEKYNLTPQDVIDQPDLHPEEYARTMAADLTHPIDVMEKDGKWSPLDGIHRLAKAYIVDQATIQVRKIPRSMIPLILHDRTVKDL